jgi:hypothetical protein
VEHFTASEVCLVGRETRDRTGRVVRLQAPPEELWANMIPTLWALDWLRKRLGSALHITSGYRDPEYNRAVGGEAKGLHPECNAIDFHSRVRPPLLLAQLLQAHPEAHRMGIGVYAGFVHVDTRGALKRPAPARWGSPANWWKAAA